MTAFFQHVRSPDPGSIAAFHLGLSGAVTAGCGATLATAGATGEFLRVAFETLPRYLSAEELLTIADLLAVATTTWAIAVGLVAFVIGGIQLREAHRARRGVGRRTAITALPGLFNPLALPLSVITILLVWLDGQG